MICTLTLVLLLNISVGDCLSSNRDIYLDAIRNFMSINIEGNSYQSMRRRNERIIFTVEDEDVLGNHTIKLSDESVFHIEIFNRTDLKKLVQKEDIKDLMTTRINPTKMNRNKFAITFSAFIFMKNGKTESWIDSTDKLGENIYEYENGCWTLSKSN